MPFRLTSTLLGGALFALAACNVTQPGASDASLAKARDQAAQGSSSYANRCAHCHGDRGEGKAHTPSIIGAGALPVYPRDASTSPTTTDPVQLQMQSQTRPPGAPSRGAFHNAQDLFDYLSKHTPEQSLRSLTPPEVWSIVTFMLIAHGSQVPAGGVTAENAGHISIWERFHIQVDDSDFWDASQQFWKADTPYNSDFWDASQRFWKTSLRTSEYTTNVVTTSSLNC